MAMTYTIRVHAIPLTDADGGRANEVTAAQFAQAVDGMNEIFAAAEVRFAFDPDKDWHPRRDTSLNGMHNGNPGAWWAEANRVAAEHRGRMVVFLRWGPDSTSRAGNWYAYPPDTGQRVPPHAALPTVNVDFVAALNSGGGFENRGALLAHEVGHYLGLFHTHPGWGPTEAAKVEQWVGKEGARALDGDLLADTPRDPGRAYYQERVQRENFCSGPTSFTVSGHKVTPDKTNVMSYYRCAPVTMTAGQVKVVRRTLQHPSRNHLIRTSAGVRYAGVFLPGDDRHALWVGDDWAGFTDKWSELSDDGLRLIDLESYVIGGRRRFSGVFRAGTGGHALWVASSWKGFVAGRDEFAKDGLRLHDFETWTEGRTRKYAGVFLAGRGGHALWVDDSWRGFTDTWRELSRDGLRLQEIETWTAGRTRKYAGVFLPGRGGHALWVDDSWKGFIAKRDELGEEGLRLHDFETWTEGRTRKYAGVFLPGRAGHAFWFNDDWHGFRAKWDELAKKKLRLVDLEVFGSLVK
ncbi:hypothetical protein [Microbacterium sp.]|uniref:hypothetical protein n=1 Tax=Microbacterium sp. TaxID=51671 RepID=UPI003A8820C3